MTTQKLFTWDEAADLGHIECILDGARGVHLPRDFIAKFDGWSNISTEAAEILEKGIDEEFYWDAWRSVLGRAFYIDEWGHRWRLYQENDLFRIRDDIEIDWGSV